MIKELKDKYVKANNQIMKDYDKNKESSDPKYWDVSNLNGWQYWKSIQ